MSSRVESWIRQVQIVHFHFIGGSDVHLDATATFPSQPVMQGPFFDHATSSHAFIFVSNDVRMPFLARVLLPFHSHALACVCTWNCRSVSRRGDGIHPMACLLVSKVVGLPWSFTKPEDGCISVSKRPLAGVSFPRFRLKGIATGLKPEHPRSKLRFVRERLLGSTWQGRPPLPLRSSFLSLSYPGRFPVAVRKIPSRAVEEPSLPSDPGSVSLSIGTSFPFRLEEPSLSNPGSLPFELRLDEAFMAKLFVALPPFDEQSTKQTHTTSAREASGSETKDARRWHDVQEVPSRTKRREKKRRGSGPGSPAGELHVQTSGLIASSVARGAGRGNPCVRRELGTQACCGG